MAGELSISPTVIPPLPDFDSNVITPGTEFMDRLATALRALLQEKLLSDPSLQHVQVLASSAVLLCSGPNWFLFTAECPMYLTDEIC